MKFKKKYTSVESLVKAAKKKGWHHVSGKGLICRECKSLDSEGKIKKAGTVRKFYKDGKVLYACLQCNSYY